MSQLMHLDLSMELQALSRRLFVSDPQPPKSESTLEASLSPAHQGIRSLNKLAASAPSHVAVFSPKKLRPRKPLRRTSDESDSDDKPDTQDEGDSDKESLADGMLDLISPTKLRPKIFTSPSSDNRLIETPTMTHLGLSYNVKYNIFICNECQSGISLTGVPDHAYKGAIRIHQWDTKRNVWTWIPGQKHNRAKMMKSAKRAYVATAVQKRILEELEDCLQRPVSPVQFGSETSLAARIAWIEIARPHLDQIGPICGLCVYKNAFKCTTGSCLTAKFPTFGLVPKSIQQHAKTLHPGMEATWAEGCTVQSMTHYINFTFYFQVTEIVQPLRLEQQSLTQADIIRQERQRLLGGLEKNQGLDEDLIHEAYGDVGMKKFWKSLEADMIIPLYDLNDNAPTSREDKLLRTAVVATFFDITRHVASAHPSLLQLIAKGA